MLLIGNHSGGILTPDTTVFFAAWYRRFVAVGGVAAGHYAAGPAAFGHYVVCLWRRSPEAIDFFKAWIAWLRGA